jgi:hypothetical protein
MRGRAALVAVHVLLEHTEIPSELTLGPVTSHLLQAIGEGTLEFVNIRHAVILPFGSREDLEQSHTTLRRALSRIAKALAQPVVNFLFAAPREQGLVRMLIRSPVGCEGGAVYEQHWHSATRLRVALCAELCLQESATNAVV